MALTKLRNRILGSLVGLGIGFGLSLIISRNPVTSFLTGVMTFTGSFIAVGVVDQQRIKQEKRIKNSFYHQIKKLEAQENQLYQSLAAANNIQEEVETKIESLYLERTHLSNRIAELNFKRNDLYRDVNRLQQELEQFSQTIAEKQWQIEALEKREIELNQTILRKSYNNHPSQQRINQLRNKVEQVKTTLNAQEEYQEKLQQYLTILDQQKQELEGQIYELNAEIKVLEQKQTALQTDCEQLQEQKQLFLFNLEKYQQEVKAIQLILADYNLEKERLNQAIIQLETNQKKLEIDISNLEHQKQDLEHQLYLPASQTAVLENPALNINVLPPEWQEWLNFAQQLSDNERKVLKAILERDEVTLKQLADQNITMPEVLIDLLNDNALKLIGDAPFTRNETSIIPEVHQEYVPILVEPIRLNFKDLLDPKDH